MRLHLTDKNRILWAEAEDQLSGRDYPIVTKYTDGSFPPGTDGFCIAPKKYTNYLDNKVQFGKVFHNHPNVPRTVRPQNADMSKSYIFKVPTSTLSKGVRVWDGLESDGILQEAVRNPLLIRNCHNKMRLYVFTHLDMMCVAPKGVFRLCKPGEVITGTHGPAVIFDRTFPNYSTIRANIHTMFASMKQKFPMDLDEWNIYGCDIIVDKDLHPWLIEINARPNMHQYSDDPSIHDRSRFISRSILKDIMMYANGDRPQFMEKVGKPKDMNT